MNDDDEIKKLPPHIAEKINDGLDMIKDVVTYFVRNGQSSFAGRMSVDNKNYDFSFEAKEVENGSETE